MSFMLHGMGVMAQTVSEREAEERALDFFTAQARTHRLTPQAQGTLSLAYRAEREGQTCFYVFNRSTGGYVVIGGDEAAREVLGWSESGTFDYATLPDNLRWWLGQYEEDICHSINLVKDGVMVVAEPNGCRKADASRPSIPPMLKVGDTPIQWNQRSPYNLAIDGGSGHFLTGCTTTAAAQVMRFHRCPTTDKGLQFEQIQIASYTDGTPIYNPAITEDYTYQWDKMLPQYSSSINYNVNDENVKDLAELFYRVSRSIDASYGTSATSASVRTLGQKLVDHFGYDKSLLYTDRSYYSDADWEQMIYEELLASRPVVYSGNDQYSNSGHAFVCDGYDKSLNTYHINWGWGGYRDSYFTLTGTGALKPNGSGAGGAGTSAEYSRNQTVLRNVMPNNGGEYQIVFATGKYTIESDELKKGGVVTISGFLRNASYCILDRRLGIMLVDTQDESKQIVSPGDNTIIPPNFGYGSLKASFSDNLEVGHSYYVYPVISDFAYNEFNENGNWQKAMMASDLDIPVVTVVEGLPEKLGATRSWKLSNETAKLGDRIAIAGTLWIINIGETQSTFDVGFKFVNIANSEDVFYTDVVKQYNVSSNYLQGYSSLHITIPLTLTVGARYAVHVVYKNNEGEWVEAGKYEEFDDPEVTIEAPDGLILAEAPHIGNGGYFTTDGFEVRFKFVNYTEQDQTLGQLTLFLMQSVSYYKSCYIPSVTIPVGGEHEFVISNTYSWYGQVPLAEGQWSFQLSEGDKVWVYSAGVTCVPPRPVTFTLTNAQWGTLCLPYDAAIPGGLTAYTIDEMEGENLVLEEAEMLEMNHPYLLTGTPGTYNFTGPATPEGTYQHGLLTGVTTQPAQGSELYAPQGSYVLQKHDETVGFYPVQEANRQKIRSCSAYLTLPSMTPTQYEANFVLYRPDEPVITEIPLAPLADEDTESVASSRPFAGCYDLYGRRADGNVRGIVVSQGKKMIR